MSIVLESINCDLCGSNNNTLLLQARDYRYGHSEIFNIVKCKNCGLIYLNPRPTAESLLGLYKKDYTLDKKMSNFKRSKKVLKWKKILRPLWYKISGKYGISEIRVKGRLLDIGCGNGDTLEISREKGAKVHGIELNPKSVKICKDKSLNVVCGTLNDTNYPDGYFDIIWMSQVIEHLPSPRNTLKEIRRILKPGGRLYVFCPNAEGYLSKFFGKYWHGWRIPFRFYAFARETMVKLATESGFKVEIESTTSPVDWFNVSLKSCLYGENDIKPMERLKLIDFLLFRVPISLIFRILDFVLPGKGDCLKMIFIKDYAVNHQRI